MRPQGNISALNYSSQVTSLLPKWIENANKSGRMLDALALSAIEKSIAKAQHFTIPDGGKIFNDSLRGLEGVDARLPYPVITVESLNIPDSRNITPFGVPSETWNLKQLCVATEIDSLVFKKTLLKSSSSGDKQLLDFLCDDGQKLISVNSFCTLNTDPNNWIPCLGILYIKSGKFRIGKKGQDSKYDSKDGGFTTRPFLFDTFGLIAEKQGSAESLLKDISSDALVDVMPLLELCESLSCSNVTHEPAYNVGSKGTPRKKGKAPLFETHRLVLKRPDQATGSLGAGGLHSSPRSHLRRGHIRRLPKGNIWVNACAVGNIKNGFIHKNYSVKGAE